MQVERWLVVEGPERVQGLERGLALRLASPWMLNETKDELERVGSTLCDRKDLKDQRAKIITKLIKEWTQA